MAELLVDRNGTCVYLTLNRPKKRNALDSALIEALTSALRDVAVDEGVRVVVLRSSGSVFCSGADLAELAETKASTGEQKLDSARALANLYRVMLEHPRPLIACAAGHAIGGGCGLALACDFVLAGREARFGFPEVRIGFVPAIVAALLLRRSGETTARDLLLSGRLVDAYEALRLRLVTQVVDGPELPRAADRLAAELARETSGQAIAATKRVLADTDALPLSSALELGARANAEARTSADFQAGLEAYLRRSPFPWQKVFDEPERRGP